MNQCLNWLVGNHTNSSVANVSTIAMLSSEALLYRTLGVGAGPVFSALSHPFPPYGEDCSRRPPNHFALRTSAFVIDRSYLEYRSRDSGAGAGVSRITESWGSLVVHQVPIERTCLIIPMNTYSCGEAAIYKTGPRFIPGVLVYRNIVIS